MVIPNPVNTEAGFDMLQELVLGALPMLMDDGGWGIMLLLFSLLLTRGVRQVQVREVTLKVTQWQLQVERDDRCLLRLVHFISHVQIYKCLSGHAAPCVLVRSL